MENMHASICFQTLRGEGMNFMQAASRQKYVAFRSKVIDTILATDMSKHFELVERISARVSGNDTKPFSKGGEGETWLKDTEQDRLMLMQAFTHMADLGHCCRPWDVHRHMVVALEKEFFSQGDEERALDMPVMPMMDRTKDSAANSQGFFLGKMVMPLLVSVSALLDEGVGGSLQSNVTSNSTRWASLIEKQGKLTAAELIEKEVDEEQKSAEYASASNGYGLRPSPPPVQTDGGQDGVMPRRLQAAGLK